MMFCLGYIENSDLVFLLNFHGFVALSSTVNIYVYNFIGFQASEVIIVYCDSVESLIIVLASACKWPIKAILMLPRALGFSV